MEVLYEIIGYIGGAMLAICTLPQIWHMYKTRSAADLQKRFLVLYLLGNILTLAYLVDKDACATWTTTTIEIAFTVITLTYKIYFDIHCAITKAGKCVENHDQIQIKVVDEANSGVSASIVLKSKLEHSKVCFERLVVTDVASTNVTVSASLVLSDGKSPVSKDKIRSPLKSISSLGFEEKFCADVCGRGLLLLLKYHVPPSNLQDLPSVFSAVSSFVKQRDSPGFQARCDTTTSTCLTSFSSNFRIFDCHVSAFCKADSGMLVINVVSSCGNIARNLTSASTLIQEIMTQHMPMGIMIGSSTFESFSGI